MDQLQQAVADHNTIVTDGNYTNASAEKQGKYTDAYQHAQNLINGSPDVVTNPADINTATQNVISAENELNGNTNLTNAKQEATEALSHLTDLTDAQRQSITNQINSATQLDEVANIKSNANALNNAMTDLRQEISHQQAVKTSQPFVDADNDRQTAYNDAINHAESIVSETTQPELNPSNVSQAMQQIKTAETGLNGAANLTRAKENALQDLNQLTHLNQAQHTDFTNQINDAQNIATVNQVTSITSSLNQAMGQLIDAVNDQKDVKQSVNYTDAEPSKQQDYNNAITSAESITNPTTGSNANQAQVETALSAINTAKQALNGTQKVNEAKNNASQELNGLDNLNNAQRENVAQKINQAQTVAEVEKIKQDAQDLNTAMTKLKESLADKDNTLDGQNYLDADNNKKTDYTNAVTNAENILNPTQGTNLTKEQVEAATNQVNSAKNDLNGTQNLNNAKQQATTNIDGLTNVTDAQKEALKQLVGNSSNVAEVQANLQKAQDVDQAMNHLKQSIADNTATKNDQNYLDASPNKQEAYNNAVDSAKDIIDNTSNPSLDPTVINQATTNVTNAKNELNGNDNLNQAKQEANQTVGGLNNLNNAQQHALNEQINHATSVDEVNQIKNNAQNLNNAMAGLKQAIADKDLTTSKVNFTDADPEKQAAYNQAITNAENILDKASGGNVSQTEVEQAIQQVNNAKQALNGDANVQQAKDEATELINNASDLNQAQKDVLKGQVNNATTVAETNGIKQTAQDLNNAMTQLKQSIADKDQTKADGNFTNADTDKQTAYNNAVTQAQQLIDGAPNVVVTPSEITDALNHVNQTKDELNGNTNLANAKQTVTNAIDQLPNLNQAQHDEYNKQITQATAVPDVNAIQTAAEKLNEAMTNLKQGIANKDDILAGEDYHDADQDKQAAFNDAISAAQDLLNQTASPIMDPTQVTNALTKVQETTQALNGNEKLETEKQNAKATITTLDHLNSAQQHALTDQIDQAPDIEHVNQIKQVAENLNNAMTALSNGLQDKTEILGNINYTDADQDKKDAYNAAIAHAENILDKANGGNVPQTEVEQALQQLTDAKQALNGNNNVQNAKNEAIQAIENASELNQAQKEALKQQVDLATTVDKVNGIKQTTQDLNQAMADLKQGIANHDQVITNGNYLNADQDKQSAYSDAVNHAQQIINGTPNAIVNPQEVTQALQQVTQTKGELNGDQNLQTAQQNATTMIDQLSNLNTPQKEALKQQVTQAGLVPDVDRVKQTANDLNTAMGNLKQQLQANSQVPQSIDYTQADNSKQVAYDNATNLAQQIVDGTPTAVLNVEDVNQALTNVNQAKDELNGNENLAQAKQEATIQLGTLQDLNQPQHDALAEQINQAQSIDAVNQIKQTAQEVNNAMNQLKQSIANKDQVLGSENYHDADADKQTAYTNAVNQAEAIINQSSNPTLNASDIENTMNQVNNTHNELNGDAKLATEKQNGNTEINAMSHLNDAQKQALTTQIEQAPDIATVNQVKQTAQNLDQAMNQLAQSINDNAQTLTDGNYLNADQQNQEAYNQAVANAENVLNQHAGTNELQDAVERLTNTVNNAKQALNGNTNLAQAQQEATQFVNQLQHLNDAQKQNYNTQINQAPLVTDVSTIKQNAQALDQAMEQLRNSIADNQDTLASEDYHDATNERQNDYNNAVNAANNIINEATSPIMNPNDINSATSQVNTTKVALDGDENLANTKQQATETIRQLSHLNQAQVQALEAQITQSSDIATVNQHLQTAQDLNSAMGNLIQAIANHNDIEQQGNYTNADNDKQTAYTDAIANAESIINPQTGQNASQTDVEQAITSVQDALQALNGDQNLQDAKVNAEQAINALVDLNDPQKQALIQQVNGAPLVTDVHQIEQNANTLNQAMHGLRESIQDNATVKTNSIYINEDPTEQQNYDQAVQHAQDIINEQTATLDENTINQATEAVNNAKQSLHGDVKLQNDKDHAKQIVSQLSHLNDAQKHMEDALIDSETTRTAVNNDLNEAQALDQLMDILHQSIADKDEIHANSQYINAEPNKQQDYDTALQNAENIIAGTNNPTINKGDVSQATQAVDNAKQALDGVQRLEEDKQNAGTSLNQFDHLTPAQQQALENAINNASTRDEVAQKLAEAQALNNAMQALKDSIQDHAQVEASSKFINEDPTQKGAYTDAVTHALDIINNDSNPILDKSAIEQATQAVNNAKDNLHGDQKLADDKQHANETLNQLNNLNTAQRDTLQNQINGASTRDEVAQIINHAQALDLAMENLKVSIKDQAKTEASSKFINEDPAQKDAYTQAVQHAQDLIDQTSNPTLDITQVDQLTQAVNNAKDNLHGDQKLEQAKQRALESLNNSTDLNQPQRQTLETQINQATTRDDINQILVNAADLNTAMGNLKASINDQAQVESSSKFINEDPAQKDAYTEAINNAKDLINQTSNPTMDTNQIEQKIQDVINAKDNLHGDQKLEQDQQQATTTVDSLDHLNHTQQQAAKDAIAGATTRTEVAQLVQTATQLDQAMKSLKDQLNQINTDKAEPNYTEASTDKQDALNQAISNAENIVNPAQGTNANQTEVEQALKQLQQTANDLNGNQRVADAKAQAKTDIDQFTHLNNEQQTAIKQNIDNATQLQPIAQIVEQATQLNTAMQQLQDAVNDHTNVENSVDYSQADNDKQQAYQQAITHAQQLLTENASQQQVEQAYQDIQQTKQALNGDERVAEAKTQANQAIDQLNAINDSQHQSLVERVNQSNDLNEIQQIVDEATSLNTVMNQLQQTITDNEASTKNSGNYINAEAQLKRDFDQAITNAQDAVDKVNGQNLPKEQIQQLIDAISTTKDALNGDQRLSDAKTKALETLDQLTNINNAQKQLATLQINNADTLNKVTRAINKATAVDQAMNALKQYVQNNELPIKSSSNFINADDDLKAQFNKAISNAQNVLNKDSGNALTNTEVEALKQAIIDAENALNGDLKVTNAKSKADKFIDSLDQLNQPQKVAAHEAIKKANDLDTINDIINNQIDLNDAMAELRDLVENTIPNSENSIDFQNADQSAKDNLNEIKSNAQQMLDGNNNNDTDVNDVRGMIESIKEAINQLNGEERLQEAKNDAIQEVNKALADKLKEINASNATEQDKTDAINKAKELANQIINDINNSTSNDQVNKVQQSGNKAIDEIHANEIPKAKIDAKNDIEQKINDLITKITNNPDLTDTEKQQLINQLNQLKQQSNNDIDNATTKEDIDRIKQKLEDAVNNISNYVKAKVDAKNEIKDAAAAKIKEIDNNPDLTPEQKAAAKDEVNRLKEQALKDIDNAKDLSGIDEAKSNAQDTINQFDPNQFTIDQAKDKAKQAIEEAANNKLKEIDNNPDLTPEQKAAAKDEVNRLKEQALKDIDNAKDLNGIEEAKSKAQDTINQFDPNQFTIDQAKDKAKQDIEEAANNKLKEIDNNPDLTPEQKAAAKDEVNRLKEQALKDIDNAKDLNGIDEAKSKAQDTINQFDPNQFTIDQAKDKAKQAIEEAANNKLKEIDNNPDLTPEQKAAAKDEVNRLKEQALKNIDNAKDLTGIDEAKSNAQDTINQFDPNQFTIDQAKDKAKQAIEEAANNKLKEIDNNPDLTPEQKAAAKDEVNRLKGQALKDIDNSKSLEDITKQQHKFISQIISVNPIKDLVKRKDDAIKNINKISTQKANDIRNSRFGTASQKQDALNRINSIVNDTIRRIKNAHTPQEVDDALRDGINRILAVQINTNIGRNRNQFNNTLNRPFDLTRVVRANQTNATTIFGNGSKEKLNGSVPSDKSKQSKDKNNNHKNTHSVTDSIANVLKKTLGFVGISGLLASFWFVMAKRRRKEEEEEMLNHKDTIKDDKKHLLSDNDHEPLLLAKQKKDETETNKQTSNSSKEKKLKGNDKDAPILIAKKKQNHKDNENKAKGKSTSNNKKVTNSKKKKKNNKKPSKRKK